MHTYLLKELVKGTTTVSNTRTAVKPNNTEKK